MSIADIRAVRRRMKKRYKGANKARTIAQAIEDERRKAARQATMSRPKK